jgi:hypothetical protein
MADRFVIPSTPRAVDTVSREATVSSVESTTSSLRSTLLVPACTPRIRHDRPIGELFVDEVPGLSCAVACDPLLASLRVRLTSETYVDMTPHVPDAVAALGLKALAFAARLEKRDAVDVSRMLEDVNADGVTATVWPARATLREVAERPRRAFLPATGIGFRAASKVPAQQARIRALVARVVPADPQAAR